MTANNTRVYGYSQRAKGWTRPGDAWLIAARCYRKRDLLRWGTALLDRAKFLLNVQRLMNLPRVLLLCGLSFLAAAFASAQTPSPAAAEPPRAAPAATAQRSASPAAARPGSSPRAVSAESPAGNTAERSAAPAATSTGPQLTFNSVNVDGPYIAMTFDDGPHGTLTPKLLDMLAARRLKATFFVVGQCVAEFPDIMKRIAREGHEIANHSWSHPNLGKMSDDAVRAQLQKTHDAVNAAAGVRMTQMRPPYGSITPRQKAWIHDEFGYRCIIWDVDPFDWKRPGAGVITSRIVNQTRAGSIILAHDIHPATVEAMPATFDQLMEKGFKFVTVSELLAMAKPGQRPTLATPKPAVTRPPGAAGPGAPTTPPPAEPAAPSPSAPNQ